MFESSSVRTFLGIDAHSGHCNLKGLSRKGKCVLEAEVPTAIADLREAVEGVPGPVWAMLESSAIAPFVKWALEPVVERVIVCETRENRWIAMSEDKSDPRDADRLARLLRMGEFKEVYVPCRDREELRGLVRLYDRTVRDGVRLKNRIKAKCREQGFAVKGRAVYTTEGRRAWLAEVSRPTVRFVFEVLYDELDVVEEAAARLARRLRGMLKHRREYRRLADMGVGPVTASIFVAVIDEPHRFATKRRLWKYAGLGVSVRSSGRSDKAKTSGSRSGNRLLKYAAMMAAGHALQGDNRFTRHHAEMVERGCDRAMADKTVARKILATTLAVWKSGARYRDDYETS